MGSLSCVMTLSARQCKHPANQFKDRVVLQFWPQSQGDAEEGGDEMILKLCHILPCSPQSSFVPTDSEWQGSSVQNTTCCRQHKSTTRTSESHFNAFFSPTLLRPWAFVFKREMRERQLSWTASFQKALEDWVDEKKKNKSKPADKSVTQRFDSSQERALQSADCKMIDRGLHFTHCHSNLAVPVPQRQDRSLIQRGIKKEQKRRNNYTAQGTKHGKGKGHLFKCSAICNTENFHSQADFPDGKGKKARWKQKELFGIVWGKVPSAGIIDTV